MDTVTPSRLLYSEKLTIRSKLRCTAIYSILPFPSEPKYFPKTLSPTPTRGSTWMDEEEPEEMTLSLIRVEQEGK